jgi:ParB family transcriptional regulator, chromosome partitioning protein
MSRKALGRGLSALIGEETISEKNSEGYLELDIDRISSNPDQPRKNFPEAELDELTQSIKANGIVQPIVVRQKEDGFQIVAGERRWRAAQKADLKKIPAVIREVSDDKLLEIALIENIQRQELNPIEEAKAYQKLIEEVGLTQEKVANQVGKTRTFVTNYLRLLRLPEKFLRFVEENKISVGHARALIMLENSEAQIKLAENIISMSLSVRETEKAVRRISDGTAQTTVKEKVAPKKDANIKNAEKKLRRHFGTQVRITPERIGSNGKIEIEYYGEADLDRIYKLLIK